MKILTIGGDRRLHFAAQALEKAGHTTRTRGTPPLGNPFPTEEDYAWAEGWLLPLPVTRGETLNAKMEAPPTLAYLADHVRPGLHIFGGKMPPGWVESLEARGAEVEDYFTDPILTLENAALTAEGAVWEWMARSEDALMGKRAAVTGYGRIARHLCRRLAALGVRVTVYARKRLDLTDAMLSGYGAEPLEEGFAFDGVDAVFNTVPARIFPPNVFSNMPGGKVFDLADGLAEAPGDATLIPLRSLPGQYAPRAAGDAIARTILRRFLSS